MSAIKPVLYRVETYIVPRVNRLPVQTEVNEIDDNKIAANRLKPLDDCDDTRKNNTENEESTQIFSHDNCVEYAKSSANDNKSISIEIINDRISKQEIICEKQLEDDSIKYFNDGENSYHINEEFNVEEETGILKFHSSIKLQDIIYPSKQDIIYPSKQFKRVNSLISIDEKSEESEGKLSDLCHHGYRNGCTATIPSPEEVSKEVFEENWLQRIEVLQQREAAVIKKETNLRIKERQLFKREKEIRIAERILRDKEKQFEQLKHEHEMEIVEKRLERTGRILEFDGCKEFHEFQIVECPKEEYPKSRPPSPVEVCEKDNKIPEKKLRNLARSKSYSSSKRGIHSKPNSRHHLASYSSIRFKERPKPSYDDLNSTLSADVGDSPFVRTSKRFNPEMYKKPYAFTRTTSEDWSMHRNNRIDAKVQDTIEEDKVLLKLSENICATHDKDTRFQNYGLVDCKTHDPQNKMAQGKFGNEGFSHLNLETGNKLNCHKSATNNKERPISWNEEASEWLQNKRQEYNLMLQKSTENKENLKCNNTVTKTKISKKKVKSKIFTLFR